MHGGFLLLLIAPCEKTSKTRKKSQENIGRFQVNFSRQLEKTNYINVLATENDFWNPSSVSNCYLGPRQQISLELESQYSIFLWRKYI